MPGTKWSEVMERKEYSGWTNWETWNCKLWIDSDEGSQGYWRETAVQTLRRNTDGADVGIDQAVHELAEILEASMDEQAESMLASQSGFIADLVNVGLQEVNYHEIARSLIDDEMGASNA
jgi:hypothetical protein